MADEINIYCDESCHLEKDHHRVMVIGAVWCPLDHVSDISKRFRELRTKYNLSENYEMKWTKISSNEKSYCFYKDVVDIFFDDSQLHFRAIVIPDKSVLNHQQFQQTHDDWYYKMFFGLLNVIIDPKRRYNIYLDYKDTQSNLKVKRLQKVLRTANYDYNRNIINRIQTVRSHEVQLIQLTDLLIGAISYINRGLHTSKVKLALIDRIKERSGYSLKKTTLLRENKVNLFFWQGQGGYGG